MTVQVQDSFTDSNGTNLDAHTPDTNVPGGSWTEVIGTDWTIQSNTANTTALDGTASIECGAADINLSCEADSNALSAAEIQSAGLCARLSDASNFWAIIINDSGNTFRIAEKNAGTYTTRASASVTINGGTLYTLTAQLSGQTITAQIDGANEISYGSAALNQTVTVHGIKARRPGDRIDDFLAETAAGGTTELVVSAVTHAHAADNVALTQAYVLAAASSTHGHTADNVALVQAYTLAVDNAEHAHAAGSPALIQSYVLAVDDAEHSHTAETPALVQAYTLTVAEAAHAHTAANVTLDTGSTVLVVADAAHAHEAEAPALTQAYVLTVADAEHSHTAELLALVQQSVLTVAGAEHAHTAESVTVTFAGPFTGVMALTLPERSTALTLETRGRTLTLHRRRVSLTVIDT